MKTIEEIEKEFENPILKASLDKALKEFKKYEAMLGKKTIIDQIKAMPLSQSQKDYMMIKLGYL